MSEFINSIDVLGDNAVVDSIIDGSIVEFKDNVITTLGRALNYSTALTVVDLPSLVSIVEEGAFNGCSALVDVNLPEVSSCPGGTFGDCSALKTIVLPKATSLGGNCFGGCKSLILVDLGAVTNIGQFCFYNTGSIKALVLRANTICEIPNNINMYNSMYVYVPTALLEEYKNYTNWSNYADKFKAIEDYTVDGTATGEFARCSGVELDKTSLTFDEWKVQALTATILTPSPLGLDELEWKSADTSIAKVSGGVVSPVSKGTTTITATCNGYSASCEVVVNVDGMNLLAGVVFNAGYISNNGSITAGGTADIYTNKFDIAVLAGSTIVVNLLDVKSTATYNRIMYYSESGAVVGYTEGSAGTNGVVITSTVPNNATLAALSINKSNGFSGIEITSDGEIVGSLSYTT